MTSVQISRADAAFITAHLDDFCELLRDSVEGGASVGFVVPLDAAVNRAYWQKVAADVASNARLVFVALADNRVVGCAHLVPGMMPNGHHRAEVQKVLVHGDFRRRGIAQQLMQAVEAEARNIGRWLLVLDTETGSSGPYLYEKLGYIHAGGVPEFALNSDGTEYRANIYYYKRLRD